MRAWLLPALFLVGCEAQIIESAAPTIDIFVDKEDPTLPVDDGPCVQTPVAEVAKLKRLTRTEYVNSVQDLLKVTPASLSALPSDEKQGILTVNSTMPLSRADVQQYSTLAATLAAKAAMNLTPLLPCNPTQAGESACGESFIKAFGRRAYRRPLTTTEVTRFKTLFETHRTRSGFAYAITQVIEVTLGSPHFLFHVERFGAADASVYELASRLSFFLWNSGPDVTLLDAAAAGKLTTSEELAAQMDRMLADPRAKAATGGFHTRLLALDPDNVPAKNATDFPNFDATLWNEMINETVTFADWVIRKGDGRLTTLLTAPYSFPEGGLYELYGAARGGAVGEPVQLNPEQRAGILTHASVLTSLANPDTTSPVRRGVMIRRNILCQGLPDPPNDAPTMVPGPSMAAQTTRERVTAITGQASSCMNCHQSINGVGFGFEHYDAVGNFRISDNGAPVDATGTVYGTRDINGPFEGAPELANKLAQSTEVQACYARQWFQFALAKEDLAAIKCQSVDLEKRFITSGNDIRALLKSIVETEAFRAAPKETI